MARPYLWRNMQVVVKYFKDLVKEKKIIINLALNDCKARFASSGLGVVWAFLQPLMTLLVFWFIFQVGFRTAPVSEVVFIVWFAPAYLVWTFFSEGLLQITNCLIEYRYLIKKVNFKVNIIPPFKIVSNGIIHSFFILIICFLNLVYGYGLSIYALQVFYYLICVFVLLLGLGWLLAAVNVFLKDVYNIIAVFIQIGFWATPIFWVPDEMNPVVQMILKLNPMYYVCTGYREAFIYKVWFWEHPIQTCYFWAIAIGLLFIGASTFEKVHVLFDDAL